VSEPYRVILADPPWKFGDSLPGKGRGASKHYGCLSVSDIARFPLPALAKDSTLVLWRVASMVEEAMFVVRAWGFNPKSELVWVKTKNGQPREPRMGMGRQVRNAHEVAIIATRGKGAARLSKAEPSVVFAPRAEHSAKPDESYELIERLYEGPRVELFARRVRDGWTCCGDELQRAEAAE
jgi:N6-adenosine-specific RNA methylase IME4